MTGPEDPEPDGVGLEGDLGREYRLETHADSPEVEQRAQGPARQQQHDSREQGRDVADVQRKRPRGVESRGQEPPAVAVDPERDERDAEVALETQPRGRLETQTCQNEQRSRRHEQQDYQSVQRRERLECVQGHLLRDSLESPKRISPSDMRTRCMASMSAAAACLRAVAVIMPSPLGIPVYND